MPKNKVILLFNLLALAGLAGALLYLRFESLGLYNTYRELALLEKQGQEFSGLKQLLLETEGERLKINNYFVTTKALSGFIERLEGLASTTSVVLELTNAELTDDQSPGIALAFKAAGQFRDLFHFVSLVETLPFQLWFARAELAFKERRENQKVAEWQGDFVLALTRLNNH